MSDVVHLLCDVAKGLFNLDPSSLRRVLEAEGLSILQNAGPNGMLQVWMVGHLSADLATEFGEYDSRDVQFHTDGTFWLTLKYRVMPPARIVEFCRDRVGYWNHEAASTLLGSALKFGEFELAERVAKTGLASKDMVTRLRLISELCTIGTEPGEAGFFRKDSPLKHNHHPRARDIGQELFQLGGHKAMLDAHDAVKARVGLKPAHELEFVWHGVGDWLS